MRVRIATKAKWLRRYGFKRLHGGRMLALWTDGLPRNSDPGTPATITLPGQAGHTATALDPLPAKAEARHHQQARQPRHSRTARPRLPDLHPPQQVTPSHKRESSHADQTLKLG